MIPMHKSLREIHTIGGRSRQWLLASEACPPMSACGILYAGWTDAHSGYRFVRHEPLFAGLITCDAGRGKVWVEGRWRDCGPGIAYLLPRGALHGYYATGGRTWRICWVAFAPSAAPPMPGDAPCLLACDTQPLRCAIEGLQREVAGPAELLATQHWVELIRTYALRLLSPARQDQRLRPLWEHVAAHLSHPWTLGELAAHAGVSDEQFRRLCQGHLLCSPMRHVTRLRMERAATLLACTSEKITTIARVVGYDNPFAFSTRFTRQFSLSPAAYRRSRIRAFSRAPDGEPPGMP